MSDTFSCVTPFPAQNGHSYMVDAAGLNLFFTNVQSRRVGGTFVYRLADTIPNILAAHDLYQNALEHSAVWHYQFQTYVVEAGGVPIGFWDWEFHVSAVQGGFSVTWDQTPTYMPGSDPAVWGIGF